MWALLFLTPDITLETLSLRLGTNRTYIGVYFRDHDMTFYQYINTLRIEYATCLMQENPNLSLRKVAEQSGFRSQPTFRKAFQEVMDCLPSEVKTNSPSPTLSQGSEYRMKQLHEDLRYSSASCTK